MVKSNVKAKMQTFFSHTFGIFFRAIQVPLIKSDSNTVIYMVRIQAVLDSAAHAQENFTSSAQFYSRQDLRDCCLNAVEQNKMNENRVSIILEFGVWGGESIKHFASHARMSRVVGFNSF